MPNEVQTNRSETGQNYSEMLENGFKISGTSNSVTRLWLDSRQGVQNPLWKSQIATGTNATTGFSGIRRVFKFGGGNSTVTWSKNFGWPWAPQWVTWIQNYEGPGVLQNPSPIDDPGPNFQSGADVQARIKFLMDIRSAQRSFQGGVALGELRETLNMIRNPLKSLRSGIDDYYRTVKRRGTKVTSTGRRLPEKQRNKAVSAVASETWLEYVFGWNPLLSDINDAAKALAFTDFREKIPVQGRGKITFSSDSSFSAATGLCQYLIKVRTVEEHSCWYKGAILGGPSPIGRPVLSNWGLSLRDFVPTVWELIPYSFLVDYFTNAGDLIDASTTCLSGLTWHCRTTRIEKRQELMSVELDHRAFQQWNNSDPDAQARGGVGYSGYQNKLIRCTRDAPILQVGLSDFRLEIPGLSSRKWLNIGALANMRRF